MSIVKVLPKKINSPKIIIIGAGIGGLSACQVLHHAGFDVLILEARDRVGGRIHTDDQLGIPLSCGAAWIHGIDHNPIARIALETQTPMETFHWEKYVRYDSHGQRIPQKAIEEFNKKFEEILEKAKIFAFQSQHDLALSQVLKKVIETQDLNPIERELFQSKLSYFEGYIGANYELLSGRYWNLEEVWPGDNCFLTGTYQPIMDYLSKNCSVQFNTIVKEIKLQKNAVEVITENSVFTADFVLSTLPLGVLKKKNVIFHPALPNEKQNAIERLGMGLLNVTFIKFPFVFWPEGAHAFALVPPHHLSIPMFLNLQNFLRQPILMGYHGGERARQIEKLSDQELQDFIMQDLRKIFGKNIPQPESLITTRWSQDIFSYGSYSYAAVGASAKDFDVMAEPIANRLFFAGEATHSKYLATTHGAYLSGIREANRIKQIISK